MCCMEIILSKSITEIPEQGIYLGGGEVDLKLWINIPEFMKLYEPFVLDCTIPLEGKSEEREAND